MGCGGGLTSGFGEHRAYSCSTTNDVAASMMKQRQSDQINLCLHGFQYSDQSTTM